MSAFRKKPVVVEAKQLTTDSMWEVYAWIGDAVDSWCWDEPTEPHPLRYIVIRTLEGNVKARDGDWVVKGIKGEFYPCKPDIFALTYEDSTTVEPTAELERMFDPARLPPPDATGFFEHPDVPEVAETQDQMIVRLASIGWDAEYEELDDCYRDEHADDYDPAKIREWAPDTQGGWQLVSKYECEDGVFALLVRPSNAEGLRDALDHIRRVARGSRTGTRRLEWIAERAHSALEGTTTWRELPAPKIVTRGIEFRRGQRVRVTRGGGVLDPTPGAEFVVDHVQPPVPARQGRVWIKRDGGGFALNFDQVEIVPEGS
jgi:hypothetical protein